MIIVKGNIFRTFLVISLIVDCSSSPAYHYLTDKLTCCFSGFMMRYETNWIILTWMLQKQLKISAVPRLINTENAKLEAQTGSKAGVRTGDRTGSAMPSFSFNIIKAKTCILTRMLFGRKCTICKNISNRWTFFHLKLINIIKDSLRGRSVTSYMLLCVTGLGSHLLRVMHNSHTLHMHIYIFQCFSSANLLK